MSVDTFAGVDYVALGHLHRAQRVGSDHIRYAGSLLKYSFNEVDHLKGVTLVDIGADGRPDVRHIALAPRHDVRIITGTLAELLSQPDALLARDDYLCAHLTDTDPVLDPMARLREVYPHMLELQFTHVAEGNAAARAAGDHRRREPDDLFRSFYRDMLGEEIGEPALAVFNDSARSVAGNDGRGGA